MTQPVVKQAAVDEKSKSIFYIPVVLSDFKYPTCYEKAMQELQVIHPLIDIQVDKDEVYQFPGFVVMVIYISNSNLVP